MLKKISKHLERVFGNSKTYLKIYSAPYIFVIKREINLTKIKETKKITEKEKPILNIGCGSMPFTAYLLAEKTGENVVAIDIDRDMIEMARKTTEKLGLQNKIKFKIEDGCNIDYSEYKAVFTALHTKPKEKLYKRFMETAEPGTPITFRKPRKGFKKQYGELKNKKPERCVSHWMLTFNKTCLYRKE